jgi:hypothetical protein
MLSAGAEALSETKGKHLCVPAARPFAELTLSLVLSEAKEQPMGSG